MTPRRIIRNDEHNDSTEQFFPLLASETVRSTAARHVEPPKSGEEKISWFWRIFGGTILSIVALLCITAYNSISSSIQDIRNNISQLSELKGEMVKKDEHNAARTRTWDKITELQKEFTTATAPIAQLKDRLAQVEEHAKSYSADRKEMHEQHATSKERLMQVDQQLMAMKSGQKDVQALQQTVTALQEKSILRDQQLKQLEDERKELLRELQALRERLARVEATKESPPVKVVPASKSKPAADDSEMDK